MAINYSASEAAVVDTSLTNALLDETTDENGNVYIYLKGVASTVAGSWVTYDGLGATTLLAANAVGLVAIAMAAYNTTSKYGWYQVVGNNTIAISDTVAANSALYIDGTAGRVDDAVVAGDLIMNAFSTAADTANVLPVYINRPYVTDRLG